MATISQIVAQAKAAAAEYDGPIDRASQQPKTPALTKRIADMGRKKSEILGVAEAEILASPALEHALATLKTATDDLNRVARVMVNTTSILNRANKLLEIGTGVINTVKSVSKAVADAGG